MSMRVFTNVSFYKQIENLRDGDDWFEDTGDLYGDHFKTFDGMVDYVFDYAFGDYVDVNKSITKLAKDPRYSDCIEIRDTTEDLANEGDDQQHVLISIASRSGEELEMIPWSEGGSFYTWSLEISYDVEDIENAENVHESRLRRGRSLRESRRLRGRMFRESRLRRGRLLREAQRKDGRNNNWAIRSLPVARDVAGNIDRPENVRYVGELSSPDRASFYGKAKLYFDDEGNEYLKSYDTFVAKKTPEGETFLLIDPVDDDWAFTATTARHIRAFASNEENFSKVRWSNKNGSWERREEIVPRIDRRKERSYHLR